MTTIHTLNSNELENFLIGANGIYTVAVEKGEQLNIFSIEVAYGKIHLRSVENFKMAWFKGEEIQGAFSMYDNIIEMNNFPRIEDATKAQKAIILFHAFAYSYKYKGENIKFERELEARGIYSREMWKVISKGIIQGEI